MRKLKRLFIQAVKYMRDKRPGIPAKIAEDARKIGSSGIQVALIAWVVVNDKVTTLEAFSLLALFATMYAFGVIAGSKEEG
jgi:hypothetical protein